MCDTQRKIIKTFTQESLDKCTDIMMENFEKIKKDLLDKLSDGIRLDIFDKINGTSADNNTEYKIYDLEDIKKECQQKFPKEFYEIMTNLLSHAIEKLKKVKVLNLNEHYVHFINHYSCAQIGDGSDGLMIFGVLTNLSNFSWLEIKDISGRWPGQREIISEYKVYDLNTPLHSIYINILNSIKSLSPQSLSGCNECRMIYSPYRKKNLKVVNIHNIQRYSCGSGDLQQCLDNNNCLVCYREIYDIIVKILNMNKKYSISMLVELDLQKKYDAILNEKEQLKIENITLKEKMKALENQLKDSIPAEHRCCICFGYTDKKKVCVPCGHGQYCSKCIEELTECALCSKTITSIVKLFV